MNSGVPVPPFIERLTGISTAMVRNAPPAPEVMRRAADFAGGAPLVAHNASFDRRFWEAGLALARVRRRSEFACSMLVSRRVFPGAPNHQLGTLVSYTGIQFEGRSHRAMADAAATAQLLLRLRESLRARFGLDDVPHELLRVVQKAPLIRLDRVVEAFLQRRGRG